MIAVSLRPYSENVYNLSGKESLCKIGSGILEFPAAFIGLGPIRLPLGGGYFRAYPYWLTKWGLESAGRGSKMRLSFIFIHGNWTPAAQI